MDDFLKDLQSWKNSRKTEEDLGGENSEMKQYAEQIAKEEAETLSKLEEEFMAKTNERERQILERLKEINIDLSKPEEESKGGFAGLEAQQKPEENAKYLSIM